MLVQRRTTTTKPHSVNLGSHQGLYVELTTPSGFGHEGGGPDGMQVGIMSVDGQRGVISALTLPAATRETLEIVTGVVGTVDLVAYQ